MYPPDPYSALWSRSWWNYPIYSSPPLETEIKMLESYREELEYEKEEINQEIEDVDARIDELAKLMEEGEDLTSPFFRASTLWSPYPPGTAVTREKELSTLENIEQGLVLQLEIVKKRLTELGEEDTQ